MESLNLGKVLVEADASSGSRDVVSVWVRGRMVRGGVPGKVGFFFFFLVVRDGLVVGVGIALGGFAVEVLRYLDEVSYGIVGSEWVVVLDGSRDKPQ